MASEPSSSREVGNRTSTTSRPRIVAAGSSVTPLGYGAALHGSVPVPARVGTALPQVAQHHDGRDDEEEDDQQDGRRKKGQHEYSKAWIGSTARRRGRGREQVGPHGVGRGAGGRRRTSGPAGRRRQARDAGGARAEPRGRVRPRRRSLSPNPAMRTRSGTARTTAGSRASKAGRSTAATPVEGWRRSTCRGAGGVPSRSPPAASWAVCSAWTAA